MCSASPNVFLSTNTPPKFNSSPLKRDELSVGNTSEPTIGFQGRTAKLREGTPPKINMEPGNDGFQ